MNIAIIAVLIFFTIGMTLLLDTVFITYFILLCLSGLAVLFIVFVVKHHLLPVFIKRLISAIVSLIAVAVLTFILLRLLPGGPFDEELLLPPAVKQTLRAYYGLDQPILTQLNIYIKNLLSGDFGYSLQYVNQPILSIIKKHIIPSLQLGLMALVLSLIFGFFFGVIRSVSKNIVLTSIVNGICILGVSIPNFILAPLLVMFFSIQLSWLPLAFWNGPSYFILPVVALSFRPMSIIARLLYSKLEFELKSDYVRAATARGVSFYMKVLKHALANSVLPLFAYLGPLTAGLLTGSFIIEYIFAIPGIGQFYIESIMNRDYTLVLGISLLYASSLIIFQLLFDLIALYLDPKVRGEM